MTRLCKDKYSALLGLFTSGFSFSEAAISLHETAPGRGLICIEDEPSFGDVSVLLTLSSE
jgi:hypothetical protein